MAYVAPTYEEFIARFPIFADKDQPLVDAIILEATNTIDTTWREVDYKPAIMYLAAHLLATDNSGEGEAVDVGGAAPISGESFGGMSLSYGSPVNTSDAVSKTQYASTEYGRRFYKLLKLNKPAIVSV